MKPLAILFLYTFLFTNFFTQKASAQVDTVSLVISPPSFELTANAGGELVNAIKVTNTSDKPIVIKTVSRNFVALGEEGSVVLEEDNNGNYSLASWVTIDPIEAALDPKETRVFNFQIKVPVDAEPGGHFGSVVFVSGSVNQRSSAGATVAQEVASLVLLKIAGDIREDIQILSFTPSKSFYEYGPVSFETRVKNNGNVHVKPLGFITITNTFGKTIHKFNSDTKNVLPAAVRRYDDKWDKKLLFGRYNANLILNYSNGKILTSSTTFYVIPYKIVIPVLITVTILLIIILRSRKRLSLAMKILFSKDHQSISSHSNKHAYIDKTGPK